MAISTKPQDRRRARNRDWLIALLCGGFAVATAALSYAAMPLYSWFYRAGGFATDAELAASMPTRPPGSLIPVRFDRKRAAALRWRATSDRAGSNVRLVDVMTVRDTGDAVPACAGIGRVSYMASPSSVAIHVEIFACNRSASPRSLPDRRELDARESEAAPGGATPPGARRDFRRGA